MSSNDSARVLGNPTVNRKMLALRLECYKAYKSRAAADNFMVDAELAVIAFTDNGEDWRNDIYHSCLRRSRKNGEFYISFVTFYESARNEYSAMKLNRFSKQINPSDKFTGPVEHQKVTPKRDKSSSRFVPMTFINENVEPLPEATPEPTAEYVPDITSIGDFQLLPMEYDNDYMSYVEQAAKVYKKLCWLLVYLHATHQTDRYDKAVQYERALLNALIAAAHRSQCSMDFLLERTFLESVRAISSINHSNIYDNHPGKLEDHLSQLGIS